MTDISGRTTEYLPWVLAMLLALMTWAEVTRVARGELFRFAIPIDQAASGYERHDARRTALRWRFPAVLAVGFGTCVLLAMRRGPDDFVSNRWLIAAFITASLFDLITTVRFFHLAGIDLEVHPAIRLLGYAYGRTVGPVLAKTAQAAGVLWIGGRLGRGRVPLLALTTCVYCGAAIYNLASA